MSSHAESHDPCEPSLAEIAQLSLSRASSVATRAKAMTTLQLACAERDFDRARVESIVRNIDNAVEQLAEGHPKAAKTSMLLARQEAGRLIDLAKAGVPIGNKPVPLNRRSLAFSIGKAL